MIENILLSFEQSSENFQNLRKSSKLFGNLREIAKNLGCLKIPFLDILVKRCPNNTFVTSIYRKKTFTGLYTKWDSFTPRKYKINLIRTLTYRCYRICSSASLLQSALGDLRKLLLQNGYPQGIISYNVNDVLNRNRNKPKSPVTTVP